MPDADGRGGEELDDARPSTQRTRDLRRCQDARNREQPGRALRVKQRRVEVWRDEEVGARLRGGVRLLRGGDRAGTQQQPIAKQPPRLGERLGNPRRREGQLDRFEAAGVERLGDPDRLPAVAGAYDSDRLGRPQALERIRR